MKRLPPDSEQHGFSQMLLDNADLFELQRRPMRSEGTRHEMASHEHLPPTFKTAVFRYADCVLARHGGNAYGWPSHPPALSSALAVIVDEFRLHVAHEDLAHRVIHLERELDALRSIVRELQANRAMDVAAELSFTDELHALESGVGSVSESAEEYNYNSLGEDWD